MASKPEQPTRKSSIDEETRQKLEKRLSARPDKKDLVERNVLKGTPSNHAAYYDMLMIEILLTDDKGVAPRLIATREKLERSQLEVKLDHALQQRPKADELVKGGILTEEEAPPA
ncbi:hypothetical protein D9615_002439 [Tricholomella constricta]|uniref:Uncharacterized protein n=1 Tax=Tricholomella constricta TaxID=117010 RepID=A0A8H5HMK3_9AGAR|nr:hypothetical protein D9615_002439 [Tricholomella constricta]